MVKISETQLIVSAILGVNASRVQCSISNFILEHAVTSLSKALLDITTHQPANGGQISAVANKTATPSSHFGGLYFSKTAAEKIHLSQFETTKLQLP